VLLLFDLDGTLFLTPDALYGDALVAALREAYGLELDGRAFEDQPGTTAMASIRTILRAQGLEDERIDAHLVHSCRLLAERYLELLPGADTSHWERAPHAEETLTELAHEHRLALVTGNPEPMARARIERLGLAGFFPAGHGAFGCEAEDRPELVARALAKEGGWPPAQTVLVGDTPRDVEGAHAAGVRAVAVRSNQIAPETLVEADLIIDVFADLPRALEQLP
jgi:phosphoglycolate phosphatase-like HAD superfamily hydrolase